MQNFTFPVADAGLYGNLMRDYVDGHPQLRPFYVFSPDINAFGDVIASRDTFPVNREALVEALDIQLSGCYAGFPQVRENIRKLNSPTTFTVTTGHQLCLATGPLFFIYKIITTINLCHRLKQHHPHHDFVPVYWMAGEDHDLAEVDHVQLGGNRIRWSTDQRGAVGRMSTHGLDVFIDELGRSLPQGPFRDKALEILKTSYSGNTTLGAATRELVLQLFGEDGLLVVDADSPSLKKLLSPLFRAELSLNESAPIVASTGERLSRHYRLQATAREINLFYLDKNLRERIVKDGEGNYVVLNTDLSFNREFILDLAARQPERFSPNVILRPLCQEILLPNIAYVGGPGELSYWMQLKDVFSHHDVFYPMLVPRNHAVLLPSRQYENFMKSGFTIPDLFRKPEDLIRLWLDANEDLSSEADSVRHELDAAYNRLREQLEKADPTLGPSVQAERQKALNGIDNLMKKGAAALKRRHEVVLSQVRSIVEMVNPDEEPQERRLNLFQFYPVIGPTLLEVLKTQLQPFDKDLQTIVY